MTPFGVCIPTLCRYDLLPRAVGAALANTLKPDRVLVIDNGGGAPELPGVEVVRPGKNLGVAASWNLGARLLAPLEVVWLNDDFFPAPDVFARMRNADAAAVLTPPSFSCFHVRRAVYESVGPFDETFWPAYYEDADYEYRLKLAGVAWTELSPDGCEYLISATIAAHRPPEFDAAFAANRVYYERKWGGPPRGGERFTTPFGDAP